LRGKCYTPEPVPETIPRRVWPTVDGDGWDYRNGNGDGTTGHFECNRLISSKAHPNRYNAGSMHRSRIAFLLLSLLMVRAAFSQQQIIVRALDARNGHPLKNTRIDLWFGDHANSFPQQSTTQPDGTTVFAVQEGKTTFVVSGEFIADCRGGNIAGKSYIDRNVYSVDDVLTAGVVGKNECGKATAQPIRGTLTIFLRPLHWWEKLHD
jgi:hypothetical protein